MVTAFAILAMFLDLNLAYSQHLYPPYAFFFGSAGSRVRST